MSKKEGIKYINMANVEVEQLKWLWYPYIPYGKITIMQGDGGDGKTFVALAIASALTRGDLLPECDTPLEVSNVIFQTAEDGYGDTIKPRLIQLGADCSRVIVINEEDKGLSLIDERIERAIIDNKAKLLVIDPIQAYLGRNVDMHRANEIRPVLRHISNVASKTGCAVILIGHLNKGGNKSQYRGLGSIDITAASRSVLVFGKVKDDENEDIRAFAQSKANLAPYGVGIAYELSELKGFNWIGAYDVTPDDLLSGFTDNKGAKKVEEAEEFLKLLLLGKVVSQKDIVDMAIQKNISQRTLARAKSVANVCSFKKERSWYWTIKKTN